MASADISRPSLGVTMPNDAGLSLQRNLALLAGRRNKLVMLRALVRSAQWGVAAAALGVLLYRFYLVDGPWWAPLGPIAGSLLLGWYWGVRQRRGAFVAARDADDALELKDRLSSALAFVAPHEISSQAPPRMALPHATTHSHGDFHGSAALAAPGWKGGLARLASRFWPAAPPAPRMLPAGESTTLVPSLVAEAAERSRTLANEAFYRPTLDSDARILLILLAILLTAAFMPNVSVFRAVEDKLAAAAMAQQGEKLVAIAKRIQSDPRPKPEDVQKLTRRLEKLGQKMVRGHLTKRAALTEMGALRQQIEKVQQQTDKQGPGGNMPQIAEALRSAPLQSDAGRKVQKDIEQNKWDEAAKKLDELADKVENNQLSQSDKEKAAADLKRVAKELRARGGQANNEAADKLEAAANALRQKQANPGAQSQAPAQNQGQSQNQTGQNQQNGQKQGQNGQQGQQGQQGPKGIQSPMGQHPGQPQQSQQGGQNGQSPQGQQGKQGQNGQQGQGQQRQGGQQGQAGQSGSQGHNSSGRDSQSSQSGQSGSQGQGQGQSGQSGGQGAADSLRGMANGLRQGAGGGGGQNLQNMMDKIREAENQTGSNGGEQSGKGSNPYGSGGQNFGNGPTESLTPGKDLMPTDPHNAVGGGPGLGPRNNAQGSKAGGGISHVKSRRTGDTRRYEDVWSDRLPKTHSKVDRVTGKWGQSGEVEQLPTRGEAKGGPVKTPYYDVYQSYKQDMEDAVSRDAVPPAYKQPVKDYFESLKP